MERDGVSLWALRRGEGRAYIPRLSISSGYEKPQLDLRNGSLRQEVERACHPGGEGKLYIPSLLGFSCHEVLHQESRKPATGSHAWSVSNKLEEVRLAQERSLARC